MYPYSEVKEHMYVHVYHDGVGKMGANNVDSLIMKTLRRLNLLHKDSASSELNMIFDNCPRQNKNNTVLKLAVWLKAAGYFKIVNFLFLFVGHTKNSAYCLFNSLKHEYHLQNIFTMEALVKKLNASESVTVVPIEPDVYFYYYSLLNDMYRDLSGQVKVNHIFSCSGDDGACYVEVESAGASGSHSHCFQDEVVEVQLSSRSLGTFSGKGKGVEVHGIP